jgi:hypothetical protein
VIHNQGCQIFLDTLYQNGEKYTKIATKLPNGHKLYQISIICIFQMAIEYTNLFPHQCPRRFSEIGIFGLKIHHLATLHIIQMRLRMNSKGQGDQIGRIFAYWTFLKTAKVFQIPYVCTHICTYPRTHICTYVCFIVTFYFLTRSNRRNICIVKVKRFSVSMKNSPKKLAENDF